MALRAIDEILFSPLVIVPVLAGIISSAAAIRLGIRSRRGAHTRGRWDNVASILGVGCGVIAILASAVTFSGLEPLAAAVNAG